MGGGGDVTVWVYVRGRGLLTNICLPPFSVSIPPFSMVSFFSLPLLGGNTFSSWVISSTLLSTSPRWWLLQLQVNNPLQQGEDCNSENDDSDEDSCCDEDKDASADAPYDYGDRNDDEDKDASKSADAPDDYGDDNDDNDKDVQEHMPLMIMAMAMTKLLVQ